MNRGRDEVLDNFADTAILIKDKDTMLALMYTIYSLGVMQSQIEYDKNL